MHSGIYKKMTAEDNKYGKVSVLRKSKSGENFSQIRYICVYIRYGIIVRSAAK